MTFLPTHTPAPDRDPTTCFCCGRHAEPYGVGAAGRNGQGDLKYLCALCLPLAEYIKGIMHFDHYENEAVDAAIEFVGPHIERNGPDITEWEMNDIRAFVADVIMSFGASLREQIVKKDAPF